MAAMTTALTEFSDNGNSRKYSLAGHTAAKPRLLIQKRKEASGNATVAENTFEIVYATVDGDGNVLPSNILYVLTQRFPIAGQSTDDAAARAILIDMVGSDEFAASCQSQNWLS